MSAIQKNILILVGIVAIFGGLVWIGRPDSGISRRPQPGTALRAPSALVADEQTFDFGTISMAGGIVRHSFTVKNGGDRPMTVARIYTSCMCTEASLIKGGERFGPFGMPGHGAIPRINREIAPQEEVMIDVTFDPAAHGPAGIGFTEQAVYIETDVTEPFALIIRANVIP